MTALPVVWLLSTGGTIAGQGASPTHLSDYRASTLTGTELLAAVPEIARYADVRCEQVTNVASPNMTPALWCTLARRIDTLFAEVKDAAGVVVTHGTSTLEETAYFLNLTVRHDRPVVLVGAQRPATALSADGPLNLLNAVRTAAAPDARGKGVLVVMNEEINGARDVTKSNTYRVETFRSGELGFLGYVDDDRVSFYRASTRRHTAASEFDLAKVERLPRVEIVYLYAQASLAPLRALVYEGVEGIVLAAPGAGSLSDLEREAIAEITRTSVRTQPVLMRSTRTGNGRVAHRPSLDGELGTIPTDNLSPQKARVLLMLALTRTRDPAEIARIFAQY